MRNRGAYMQAAAKRRKLKELQNTEGTVERADYLNSPRGLAVETIKGVGRILDTPFRKGREFLEKLESTPKPTRRRRKGPRGGI